MSFSLVGDTVLYATAEIHLHLAVVGVNVTLSVTERIGHSSPNVALEIYSE